MSVIVTVRSLCGVLDVPVIAPRSKLIKRMTILPRLLAKATERIKLVFMGDFPVAGAAVM